MSALVPKLSSNFNCCAGSSKRKGAKLSEASSVLALVLAVEGLAILPGRIEAEISKEGQFFCTSLYSPQTVLEVVNPYAICHE